ncbi:AAA family ATPase [Candidatus Woesearchaeota archaeon]|nr:AAA family ATPase [Candidatus Woesearchaeota archaeon]MBW3022175.1 AAA family ATPase [Candidatus Woesearchaeota archaeon]
MAKIQNKKIQGSRVRTGIPGFDSIVQGGLINGSVNLLSGGPGTGKTIFCMQYLYNGATKFNENGLFISFEENLAGLKADAKVFGWNFDELEKKGLTKFMTFKPFNNPGLIQELRRVIRSKDIKRVVIDSISVFSMAFNEDYFKIRKELYNICGLLEEVGCTTILTAEISGEAPLDISAGGRLSRDGIVEFIADSVVTLHNSGIGGEADRALRVLKMRRTDHEKSPVPMKISKEGIKLSK